jgi:hypothetical protein
MIRVMKLRVYKNMAFLDQLRKYQLFKNPCIREIVKRNKFNAYEKRMK